MDPGAKKKKKKKIGKKPPLYFSVENVSGIESGRMYRKKVLGVHPFDAEQGEP